MRIVHKKRGTVYDTVGEGTIQCDRPLADYDKVTIYKDPYSGDLWVRPVSEMADGRFVEVADTYASGFSLTKREDCPRCRGHGRVGVMACNDCGATGQASSAVS